MDSNIVPPAVAEFLVGERAELLGRIGELEAESSEWSPVMQRLGDENQKLRAELAALRERVPEVLLTALRQYRHNCGGNDLIAGYDYAETNRIVAALQAKAVVLPDLEAALDAVCGSAGNTITEGDPLYSITLAEIAEAIRRLNGKVGDV